MSVRVSEYERALGKRTGRKEKERESCGFRKNWWVRVFFFFASGWVAPKLSIASDPLLAVGCPLGALLPLYAL